MLDDVDLIVRTRSLCEIDSEIRLANFMLDCADGNEIMEPYWLDRLWMLEGARDIAEFCIDNDIPTNDTSPYKPAPKDYRVIEMLDKLREHDNDIKGLKKRIPHPITPPLKNKKVFKERGSLLRFYAMSLRIYAGISHADFL